MGGWQNMKAEIISVGSELLTGHINNSNGRYFGGRLNEIGFEVLYITCVADDESRLKEVLGAAFKRADVIIISGGMGPTYNDITKEIVCSFLGLELELNEESLEKIKNYFWKTGRRMYSNNKKQAMFPPKAHILPNKHGTAPGCIIEKNEKSIILLPGPPREAKPIFENQVIGYLQKKWDLKCLVCSLRLFGIGESAVEREAADIISQAHESIKVMPLSSEGEVAFRISVSANNVEECQRHIEEVKKKLESRLGKYIYGTNEDTLEKTAVNMLLENQLIITTAESCTGGLIASKLTDVPGASEIFSKGFVTYSNESKTELLGVKRELIDKYGAVSRQVVEAMAYGALEETKADIALASTGFAGPEGEKVGLAYVTVTDGKYKKTKKVNIVGGRSWIKLLVSKHVINELRLFLREQRK